MKIFITGSAGFIGYNFCKHLLEKTKYKIISVDNLNNYYSTKVKLARLRNLKKYKRFKFYKLDLLNKKKLSKIFNNKFDAVFHFAAQAGVRYSLENPRSYIDSNIVGFFNLIEQIKQKKINKFFYASSSSVYGESTNFPLKEGQIINPKNIYGLSKKINEEMIDIYFHNTNTKCVGLRFFTVFGEWGRPDMLIYKYLSSIYNKNSKFYLNNYGNHTRDFTYMEDVKEILMSLLKKKIIRNNVYNICSNHPVKITRILKLIDKNFKLKPKIYKRSFQKADVKKTHGSNKNIKLFCKKRKFIALKLALNNTCNWYKKNWKIFT